MGYETKAAAVTPPVQGLNVWAFDAFDFSTADYVEVPESWKGAILRFHADGEDFAFSFGDDTLTTIDETAKSTVASNVITSLNDAAFVIDDGDFVDCDMSLVEEKFKARLVIKGITGTATNLLRVTRMSGYAR